MAGFFRSAWEQLGNLFGEDISPYPPGYERPGQKRKARGGRPGLQRRKARRLSQGRAEPQYTVPDYREADFYNGYARTSFHRDSLPGSFDLREGARYLETGSDTYLEEPRGQQGKGGRLSLSLTGARVEDIENETEDIKEKIDDLPVPEDTKEEVRQEVAQHILESPGSPGRAPRTPSARPQRPRSATPPPSRRMSGGRGRRASSADLNWTDFPNRTARQTLEGYDSNKTQAAIAIRDGLRQSDPARKSEPLYSLRDIEIRDGLWQLNDKLESFTMEHYNFDFGANGPGNKELLDTQLAKMPQATVDLIGCVASGGPSGPTGWRNLFFNKQKRRALVCAIIGEILEGQVLEHLFFGCSAEHEQNLERLQQEHAGDDGTLP